MDSLNFGGRVPASSNHATDGPDAAGGNGMGMVRSLQDGARLSYKYAFGVAGGLGHGAISFCTVAWNRGDAGPMTSGSSLQDALCYPVGRSVALYQIDDGEMQFLPPNQEVTRVISLAVSPNKKLIAVCEEVPQEGEASAAQLSVYGLHTMTLKATLKEPSNTDFPDFICASFTGDSKVVYALTGDQVVGWHWEREKILSRKSLRDIPTTQAGGGFSPCTKICVNPASAQQVTVSGNFNLKYLTPHVEKSMKMYSLLVAAKERDNFADHTWVAKGKGGHWMVAITDGNAQQREGRSATIYVLDAPEGNPNNIAPPVQVLHPRLKSQNTYLETVEGYNKGFIVAGFGGYFGVYEQNDDRKDPFACLRTLDTCEQNFRNLAVSPHGEVCAAYSHFPCSRAEGSFQLMTFPLGNIDSLVDTEPSNDEVFSDPSMFKNHGHAQYFQPLIPGGVHADKVTAMGVCLQQPILVTIGESEKTLRVWDYLQWRCRFEHAFRSEEPMSVSVHPTGFQMLVSLKDRVRVFNLMADSLRWYKELAAKNCRAVAYSRGGQQWACAVGLNISVYSSYSFHQLHTLQIHTAPPKILVWSPDDTHLYAGDMNGNAFEWDLVECRQLSRLESNEMRSGEEYKGLVIHSVENDKSFILAATSSEIRQRQWVSNPDPKAINYENLQPHYVISDDQITCMSLSSSGKWLFCGMESGDIRVYAVPLLSDDDHTYNTFRVHSGPPGSLLSLQVSSDDSYIFVSADDGCIYTLSLQEIERGIIKNTVLPDARNFNVEAVMVSQEIIDQKNNKIIELKKIINEAETEFTFKQHQLEREHKDKLTSEINMKDKELEKERERYQKLNIDFEDALRSHTDILDVHDSNHMQKMKELENQYEHKLADEMERYDRLSEEIEAMQQRCEGLLDSKAIEEEQTLRELEMRYKKELRDKEIEITKLKEDLVHNDAITKETLDQQETEYEKELQSLMAVAEKELAAQREEKAKIRASLEARRTQRDQYKKSLKEVKSQNDKLEEENRKLRKEKKELEDTYKNQETNLLERENTLSEKEKIIQDLRSNNRTLDNFRFVLDHRLQQLMEERGPITKHIEDLENFIHKMYEELVMEGNTQKEKDRSMVAKDERITALISEVTKLRTQIRDKERYISSFKRELAALVSMTVPKELEDGVKLCYKKFVRGEKSNRGKGTNPSAYKEKGRSATALIKDAGDMSGSSSSESDFDSSSEDDNDGRRVRKGQVAAVELELVERAEEAQRQVSYMQTATGKLKTRLEMTKRIAARQNRMKLGENSALIKECNDLRRDNFTLRRDNDHIRQQVKDLQQALMRMNESSSLAASESRTNISESYVSSRTTRRSKKPGRSPISSQSRSHTKGFRSAGQSTVEFSTSMPTLHSRETSMTETSRASSIKDMNRGPKGSTTGRLVLGSAHGITKVQAQGQDIDRLAVDLDHRVREIEMQKIEISKLREIIRQMSKQPGRGGFETKYYGLGPEPSGVLEADQPDGVMRSRSAQDSQSTSHSRRISGAPSQWSHISKKP